MPLVLPTLPDVTTLNTWRTSVRGLVATSHRDPGRALRWVQEVEATTAAVESLGEGRKRWRKLDRKLLNALYKLSDGTKQSSLRKSILNEQEAQQKRGRVFTGRQALRTIYQFYEINKDTATIPNTGFTIPR